MSTGSRPPASVDRSLVWQAADRTTSSWPTKRRSCAAFDRTKLLTIKNIGGRRPSSAPFKDAQMSVDAEPILLAQGLDVAFSLSKHRGYSLVSFTAGVARAQ